ncbi:MAG: pentapeptide repeat-containing protein [SAR324 cluster bacterium]|nr:pentapeptide repeat-containing protein [SAR324 cluster bacterium]
MRLNKRYLMIFLLMVPVLYVVMNPHFRKTTAGISDDAPLELSATEQSRRVVSPLWLEAGMEVDSFSKDKLNKRIKQGFKFIQGAPLEEMDLTGAYLMSMNLSGTRFNRTILKNAQLINTVWAFADLTEADLSESTLRGARFKDAIVVRTNFQGARLQGAQGLPEWVMQGVSADQIFEFNILVHRVRRGFNQLDGSRLTGGDFSGVFLKNGSFQQADLSHVNFSHADLRGSRFDGAVLDFADFSGADVRGACFIKVRGLPPWISMGLNDQGVFDEKQLVAAVRAGFHQLQGAFLPGADFSGVRFSEADVRQAVLPGANFSGSSWHLSNFEDSDLSGSLMTDVFFEKTLFHKARWHRTQLEGAVFDHAEGLPPWIQAGLDEQGIYHQKTLVRAISQGFKQLQGAQLEGALLEAIELTNANLEFANLKNTRWIRVNLPHSSLRHANLQGAQWLDSDCQHVDLSEANLAESDWERTDLRHGNLTGVYLNETGMNQTRILALWKDKLQGLAGNPSWE